MDIKLNDETGDVLLSTTNKVTTPTFTTTTSENLAQRLKIRLQTFKGEWFLDGTIGIDYFNQIAGKNRSKAAVDAIIQAEILQEQEVLQITAYSSVIDKTTRKITIQFTVRTIDGFYSTLTANIGV
jgi:hypothetical protein